MPRLGIRAEGLEAALAAIDATDQQIRRASRRAVTQTTRFAASELARGIARNARVPLKVLTKGGRTGRGKRVFVTPPRGLSETGYVWVGLDPLKPPHVGTPRQTPAGARTGQHFFERAFVATMRSGYRSIFRRDGRRKRLEPRATSGDRRCCRSRKRPYRSRGPKAGFAN